MLFPFSSCTLIFELVPSASILYKAYELFVPKSLVCIMLILLTVVYKALAPDMSKCVTFPIVIVGLIDSLFSFSQPYKRVIINVANKILSVSFCVEFLTNVIQKRLDC